MPFVYVLFFLSGYGGRITGLCRRGRLGGLGIRPHLGGLTLTPFLFLFIMFVGAFVRGQWKSTIKGTRGKSFLIRNNIAPYGVLYYYLTARITYLAAVNVLH